MTRRVSKTKRMLTSKRLLALLSCLALFFIFAKLSNAQDKEKYLKQAEDKISGLEKEKGALIQQIATLEEELNIIERDKAFLESMLTCKYRDLRPPQLVKTDTEDFDKVISLNLGFAYGSKGKIKEAIEEYKKALKYDPEDKDIHYNLGYLLAKEYKCTEAIEEYKKALKGLPDDKEIYYNLSIIYAACLKDIQTAEYYYNRFLNLSSENTTPKP